MTRLAAVLCLTVRDETGCAVADTGFLLGLVPAVGVAPNTGLSDSLVVGLSVGLPNMASEAPRVAANAEPSMGSV